MYLFALSIKATNNAQVYHDTSNSQAMAITNIEICRRLCCI